MALIDELNLGQLLRFDLLAPETLLHYLSIAGAPISDIIADIFRDGLPNAVHHAIATALNNGACVWTTNVDELIESTCSWSAQDQFVFYGKNSTRHLNVASFFKIHGTVSDTRSFAFRSPEVISPLPSPLRTRFVASIRERRVLIAGYAGLDPDFRSALDVALPLSASATWYELPQACAALQQRFRPAVTSGRLTIVPTSNPSVSLLAELTSLGCCDVACQSLASLVDEEGARKDVHVDLSKWKLHRYHFAAGQLLEHLGASDQAIRRYLRGAITPNSKNRSSCRTFWIGAALYSNKQWAKPIRKLLTAVVHVPGHLRWTNAISLHSRLLEREGDYLASLHYSVRAIKADRSNLGKALDVSAAARKAGKLRIALAFSKRAVGKIDSGTPSDGVLAARALFEYVYALRLCGRSAEAMVFAERLESGLDFYGGPNWVAWAKCQKGNTIIQSTTRFEEGVRLLVAAQEMFFELGDLHKAAAVTTNLATAYRASGKLDEAVSALSSARTLRERSAHHSPFELEVIEFEDAELARIQGSIASAKSAYLRLSESKVPIHAVLAFIGLSEIEADFHGSQSHAVHALNIARRHGFRFGEAHALFALAGRDTPLGRANYLQWINDSRVFLFPVTSSSFSVVGSTHNVAFPS